MVRRVRPQQRDTVPLRLPDGRDIELLRVIDPRARRLRLLVSERGPRLTIPPAASIGEAQRFLEQHLHWLADQLAEDPHATVSTAPLVPGGKVLESDSDVAMYLLEEAGVGVVAGKGYGMSPFLRLSFAAPRAAVEEGARRIGEACASLR